MVQVCKYSIQKSADILTTVVHLQLGQTDNKSKPWRCMYQYLNIIKKWTISLPAIIPLVSVWAPVFPNMISDTPTNARPTSMMKIPVHITLRIVDPRNATDKRAVKMMTAPNKDYISLGKIQRWSKKCSKEDNRRCHTASDSNSCIIFND